jgi:hypothetical protein
MRNGDFALRGPDERAAGWYDQRQVIVVRNIAADGRVWAQFDNDVPGRRSHLLQMMPVDGRQSGSLHFELRVRLDRVVDGPQRFDKAGLQIGFFDDGLEEQRVIAIHSVGSSDWHTVAASVQVPRQARKIVINLGLNGATGHFLVESIKLAWSDSLAEDDSRVLLTKSQIGRRPRFVGLAGLLDSWRK